VSILGDNQLLFKLYTSVRRRNLDETPLFRPDSAIKDNFGRTMWHCAMKPGSFEAKELIDPEHKMLMVSILSLDQQYQRAI